MDITIAIAQNIWAIIKWYLNYARVESIGPQYEVTAILAGGPMVFYADEITVHSTGNKITKLDWNWQSRRFGKMMYIDLENVQGITIKRRY